MYLGYQTQSCRIVGADISIELGMTASNRLFFGIVFLSQCSISSCTQTMSFCD